MIPAPIVAAVVAAAVGFGAGWQVCDWRRDSIEAEGREQAAEAARENRRGAGAAAWGHEQDRERVRVEIQTVTETVEKIVEKPVYRAVCFDDSGLRALATAVGNRAATSEPGGTLSGPEDAR